MCWSKLFDRCSAKMCKPSLGERTSPSPTSSVSFSSKIWMDQYMSPPKQRKKTATPKFNIAAENGWLEDYFSFWDGTFSGAMLNFRWLIANYMHWKKAAPNNKALQLGWNTVGLILSSYSHRFKNCFVFWTALENQSQSYYIELLGWVQRLYRKNTPPKPTPFYMDIVFSVQCCRSRWSCFLFLPLSFCVFSSLPHVTRRCFLGKNMYGK